jgi:hypothetical protein
MRWIESRVRRPSACPQTGGRRTPARRAHPQGVLTPFLWAARLDHGAWCQSAAVIRIYGHHRRCQYPWCVAPRSVRGSEGRRTNRSIDACALRQERIRLADPSALAMLGLDIHGFVTSISCAPPSGAGVTPHSGKWRAGGTGDARGRSPCPVWHARLGASARNPSQGLGCPGSPPS